MARKRVVRGAVLTAMAALASLTVASPAQAIKMRYVQEVNVVDGDSVETVDAMCPDGFNATGGGGFSNGALEETRLQDSYPIDDGDGNAKPDDGWRATIWNTAPTGRNSQVQAVCAKARTKYATAINQTGNAGKRAKCPNGSSVSGGGINVNESFAFPYDILESIPVDYDPGSARARAWFTFLGGPGMAATPATVYAACIVDKDAKLQARREFFDVPADSQAGGEVLCKRDEKMTGVGGVVSTQQGAMTTMFGADGSDNNLRLDDGGMVIVDNRGVEPLNSEAYTLCAE